jgi:hypothetical protein
MSGAGINGGVSVSSMSRSEQDDCSSDGAVGVDTLLCDATSTTNEGAKEKTASNEVARKAIINKHDASSCDDNFNDVKVRGQCVGGSAGSCSNSPTNKPNEKQNSTLEVKQQQQQQQQQQHRHLHPLFGINT